MDAFYASVELLRYPQLRGVPLVVGGRRASAPGAGSADWPRLRDYVGRGVATTASYEARALGVHSAMGLMKAARLAPDAVLLPADFEQYRQQSRAFKAALVAIAPAMEDRSIDEVYLDLTAVPETDTVRLAQTLKDAVQQATGLRCSIGISPNKLLSKIASDLDKPDGLTVLGMADVPVRIWPLPVRKLHGVGPKAEQRLQAIGVHTIGALAATPPERLQEQFGLSYAQWLHEAAHGRDDRPVVTHSEPRSISRETTFERDLDVHRDRAALTDVLTRLCEQLAADLERKQVQAGTIGVKVRFADFQVVTRDRTPARALSSPADLLAAARSCLRRVTFHQRLRLLGVRASNLSPGRAPGSVQGVLA